MLYDAILCSIMWWDAIRCYVILWYVMLWHVMLFYAMSCYVILCYVASWYVMLSHALSCCVMVPTALFYSRAIADWASGGGSERGSGAIKVALWLLRHKLSFFVGRQPTVSPVGVCVLWGFVRGWFVGLEQPIWASVLYRGGGCCEGMCVGLVS